MIMKFRKCKNVSEPSYKALCNVLCIWACLGHPYLYRLYDYWYREQLKVKSNLIDTWTKEVTIKSSIAKQLHTKDCWLKAGELPT